jgi:hypothetical protein
LGFSECNKITYAPKPIFDGKSEAVFSHVHSQGYGWSSYHLGRKNILKAWLSMRIAYEHGEQNLRRARF